MVDGLERSAPTLRDPDGYSYFKEEVRGLLMGGFEPDAKPWVASDEIPEPFEFQLLPEDWEQFDILMRNAVHRVPAMESAGVKKFYNGPESFTPDHNFIMGAGPGAGQLLRAGRVSTHPASRSPAEQGRRSPNGSSRGEPELDLVPSTSGGSRPCRATSDGCAAGSRRSSACTSRWPGRTASRRARAALRRSPVHHLLRSARRLLRHEDGLGTGQLVRAGRRSSPSSSTRWGRQNWFGYSAAEHAAARADVALFDQTSFAKIAVRGADAEAALQYLCANDVAVPPGRTVYTRAAQRPRRLRGRRDHHPAAVGRVPAGDQQRAGRARPGPAAPRRSGRACTSSSSTSPRPTRCCR